MARGLWQPGPVPFGFTEVWHQELTAVAELPTLRARLRAELTGSSVPALEQRGHEKWSERMVLVVDELASNGLRHSRPPVRATLSRCGDEWLITVTDSTTQPPRPAEGRDPARGGFGLYLVADLADRHGWLAIPRGKVVWAVLTAALP